MKKKTVFFFGYSWASPQRLDAYQQSIADEFKNRGFDVRIYYANLFSNSDGMYGIFPSFENRLIKEIRRYRPIFVFSMNFGLLSDAICDAVPETTRIVTWIVDDIEHLFRPNSKKLNEQSIGKIHRKITVYTFSSAIYNFFKTQHPELDKESLIFSASVTDPDLFKAVAPSQKSNIVFVGSFVDTSPAILLMHVMWKIEKMRTWVLEILKLLEKDYADKRITEMLNQPMIQDFLALHKLNTSQLKMYLSNLISANLRTEMVNALNPLGIKIFGNLAWIAGLSTNLASLECFQADSVTTREDLVRIYQSSKIAVQVPQIQVEGALSYRVFDIMASSSLLIHAYHPDSDLYKYFGKDCPVPTFKNQQELFELCEYYLSHESERLEIVRKCNALVEKDFSFKSRVNEMIVGVLQPKTSTGTIVDVFSKRSEISITGTLLYAFRFFLKAPDRTISLFFVKVRNTFSGWDKR